MEHTHIFKECRNLYNEMSVYNEYQKNWYQKKWEQARPLKDYIDYIEKLKQIDFPIRLKFGLEVCYFQHGKEEYKEFVYFLFAA